MTSSHDSDSLRRLGYGQELLRSMGGFSNFAISFSVISILTGTVTLYSYGLGYGGPLAMTLGWPIVTAGTLLVAIAMAELSSAFPTAGALYHWSALLGGPGAGWWTACFNLVGQFAITAAVDFGCAKFVAAFFTLSDAAIVPLYAGLLISHGLINHYGVRLCAWLNDFSASVHIVGVVILIVSLICFGRVQPLSFLTHPAPHLHPGSGAYLFTIALLQSLWTFTGFDASAHVAEETTDAANKAPWGIVLSVAVSGLFGYLLLIALTLAIKDGQLLPLASDDTAPLRIVSAALGNAAGRGVMALAILAMWFCGLSSVTANSRMLFAFARDRGIFASDWLRHIGRQQTPSRAVWVSVAAAFVVVAAARAWSETAFIAVTSLSTVALYCSYALPIACGLIARRQGRWSRMGPWQVGRAGPAIAGLALVWLTFAVVICMLPPNVLVAQTMTGLCLILVGIYFARVRGRFSGPAVSLQQFQHHPL